MDLQFERPVLRLDWCSYEAAKYAVMHWHYSKSMPPGKAIYVGAWESEKFIGVVIFSRGANNHIGNPYGLTQLECCELTRIALTEHISTVSRIASLSLKFLKRKSPGIKLVISYADPDHGHHGGIYQAMNCIYVGTSNPQRAKIIGGKQVHKRSVSAKFGKLLGFENTKILWKHKYIMPLDSKMRERILTLSKPYPKRAVSIAVDAPDFQSGEGGSSPTTALQTNKEVDE